MWQEQLKNTNNNWKANYITKKKQHKMKQTITAHPCGVFEIEV